MPLTVRSACFTKCWQAPHLMYCTSLRTAGGSSFLPPPPDMPNCAGVMCRWWCARFSRGLGGGGGDWQRAAALFLARWFCQPAPWRPPPRGSSGRPPGATLGVPLLPGARGPAVQAQRSGFAKLAVAAGRAGREGGAPGGLCTAKLNDHAQRGTGNKAQRRTVAPHPQLPLVPSRWPFSGRPGAAALCCRGVAARVTSPSLVPCYRTVGVQLTTGCR